MVKKYIRRCKNCFPVYGREERQFLKKLKKEMEQYIQENVDVTYQQIEEQFGTPIDVIKAYYDSLEDENRLINRVCFSKYLKRFCIIVFIVLLSFFMYRTVLVYWSYLDAKDTKVIYEENTIEYDDTDFSK